MGIARYLSKLASGLSSEGVVSAAKGGTGSTSGATGAGGPKISSIAVTDSSYNNLDDTAVDVAGGYIKLTGSGFASGCQVLVGSTPATSTTFVSSTEVRAQVPATTAGTYIVYLVNSDGGVAIRVNGITFSTTPTWTTGSGLSAPVNSQISIQLAATGASTFSVASGSSLPSGVSLSSSGLLSGSITGLTSPTTYTFTILATDTELQDSPQTFSFSISVGEPYFKYVSLLLSADGTNAAQNNTFVDSSTNNFAITRAGNATQGTFTPYGDTWSTSFVTDAVVKFPYASALSNWWTQDFTIEMWVFNNTNAASATNGLPLQFAHGDHTAASTYWAFGTTSSGTLQFYYYNGGTNSVTSTATLELGKWHHVAMVYINSTGNISLYLNGVSVASATKSGTPQSSSSNTLNIGAVQGSYYNGYISNLRVLNGTALYTSTFTPSITPLTAGATTQLLACQSNRFKDNSTNNAIPTIVGSAKIQKFSPFSPSAAYSTSTIGGSAYFDGTGDYLSLAGINLGSGDFTIEGWIYPTNSAAGAVQVIYCSTGSGSQSRVTLQLSTSMVLQSYIRNSDATNIVTYSGSGAVPVNTWSHVAVVRNSGNIYLYVNGTLNNTPASSTQNISTNATATYIGSVNTAAQLFFGNICDLRVNTTAVYTTAFIPSSVPLSAISGTSLLCNFTNAGIYDAAMMNDLETVGNAQLTTTTKKYGTAAIAFDGTGDYLNIANSNQLNFGTGDFTVECWAYFNSLANIPMIWHKNAGSSGWFFEVGTSSVYFGHGTASGTQFYQLTASLSTGTWYHLAVTRVGNILSIFINGTKYSSAVNGAENSVDNTAPFIIGSFQPTNGSYDLNGYIDDFRITKGYARYTANFTPPTSAHPLQ